MKLGFFHDHVFTLLKDGKFYSPGKFSLESFCRYKEFFDEVIIVSRYKNSNYESLSGYNDLSSSWTSFFPFENQSSIKNRFFKRSFFKSQLSNIIEGLDGVVVRLPSEIGFLAVDVCRQLDKPYIVEVVACPDDAMIGFNNFKSKLYRPIIVNKMKESVRKAWGALYVTNNFLQNRYPCSGVISNASNVEIETIKLKSFSSISQKDHIFIALVGNLDSCHKGYDVLYRALDEIDKIGRKFTVYLVGSGNLFVRDLVFSNVDLKFTGALSKKDIFNLLDSMDVYLQPSSQEGLPRATIEAMSRGLPCIVSNAGGLTELIDSDYVHHIGDEFGLVTCLKRLIEDDDEYNRQSISNSKKCEEYRSVDLKKKRSEFYGLYFDYIKKCI